MLIAFQFTNSATEFAVSRGVGQIYKVISEGTIVGFHSSPLLINFLFVKLNEGHFRQTAHFVKIFTQFLLRKLLFLLLVTLLGVISKLEFWTNSFWTLLFLLKLLKYRVQLGAKFVRNGRNARIRPRRQDHIWRIQRLWKLDFYLLIDQSWPIFNKSRYQKWTLLVCFCPFFLNFVQWYILWIFPSERCLLTPRICRI